MGENDFHYVAVLLELLYGIELEDEDLEELGLIAWEYIGNKDTKLYRYSACINPQDLSVTLPCNAFGNGIGKSSVELVTASYEDWKRTTNYSDYGDNNTSFVEESIEAEKTFQSLYYLPGKILKYEEVGDKLYFTHNYGRVNILYKGIVADEEGLPKLTNKEAMAIATYIAYVLKFKESLITNNAAANNLAILLELLWRKQCDLARVTYLNQNDINNILDVKSSWDRHSYGKGSKLLK